MTGIVVTGGTGIIGRHAVRALVERGHEIHLLGRVRPVEAPAGTTFHQIDLLDPVGMRTVFADIGTERFLHLAWVTAHGAYWRASENLDWAAATLLMARAFVDAGGKRMVVCGTCAEYDWTQPSLVDGNCVEDTTPIAPHTLYGTAKDACRRTLAAFAAETGLSWAWGRVFLLFDPIEDRRRFVATVIDSLKRGVRASCSAGTPVRDFLSACDVGAALAMLASSDVDGAVNIASGEARSLAEVAHRIGEVMGRPDLIGLGDLPMRPDDPPRLVADVSRLRDEVGFRPPADFAARLAECVTDRPSQPSL